jgi:hypothetical protein
MTTQQDREHAQKLLDIRNAGRSKRTIVGNTLVITNGSDTINLSMFTSNVQSERTAIFR